MQNPLDEDIAASLRRIAAALDRLTPPPPPAPDFAAGVIFRHDAATSQFCPAPSFALDLDLLVGVETQKARILETLSRFARGFSANHVLLWGGRGTGKSSLAKAAFMRVAREALNLRLIEVDRDEIARLPALFERLRGRPERFLVFCDDLSFEEGAASAKALKSALEGGVSGPPANVLFLATSNRRHLMPRRHDQDSGPLAAAEDTEEDVSVSDRFGLWIGFGSMSQDDYLAAVRAYATKFDLAALDLDVRALRWARQRGSRSGRVAWQFARQLAGECGKALPI